MPCIHQYVHFSFVPVGPKINQKLIKLNESMARQHLVTPVTSPFKVMSKVKPNGNIWGPEFNQYVCFSFHGNQTISSWDKANSIFDLENSRSRSWPRGNLMATFEALSSKSNCLLFVSWQSDHFWLRSYSKFNIWPWKFKFKFKVMAKVKSDYHIWGLEFNRYKSIGVKKGRWKKI